MIIQYHHHVLFVLLFGVSLRGGTLGFAPGFLSSRTYRTLSPRSKVGNVKPSSCSSSSAKMAALVESSGEAVKPPLNDTISFAAASSELFALDTSSSALPAQQEEYNNYAVEQTSLLTATSFWEQPSVLMGRGLAVLAAAIYGTNFAAVKILNDSLPVSLAASLRFGIGLAGVAAAVLWSEHCRDANEAGEQYFQVYENGEEVIPVSKAELYKERTDAMWSGAEVGLWYSAGYIAQAVALLEVDASKVSSFFRGHGTMKHI